MSTISTFKLKSFIGCPFCYKKICILFSSPNFQTNLNLTMMHRAPYIFPFYLFLFFVSTSIFFFVQFYSSVSCDFFSSLSHWNRSHPSRGRPSGWQLQSHIVIDSRDDGGTTLSLTHPFACLLEKEEKVKKKYIRKWRNMSLLFDSLPSPLVQSRVLCSSSSFAKRRESCSFFYVILLFYFPSSFL